MYNINIIQHLPGGTIERSMNIFLKKVPIAFPVIFKLNNCKENHKGAVLCINFWMRRMCYVSSSRTAEDSALYTMPTACVSRKSFFMSLLTCPIYGNCFCLWGLKTQDSGKKCYLRAK